MDIRVEATGSKSEDRGGLNTGLHEAGCSNEVGELLMTHLKSLAEVAWRAKAHFPQLKFECYMNESHGLILLVQESPTAGVEPLSGRLHIGHDGFTLFRVAQKYHAWSEGTLYGEDPGFYTEIYESVEIFLNAFLAMASLIHLSQLPNPDRQGFVPVFSGSHTVKFNIKRSTGFIVW